MEKIELRSEKVRNIIGTVPPVLVRIGNLVLFLLLGIIFALAYYTKIPNTLTCDVSVKEENNMVQLVLTSCSKLPNESIVKGTPVLFYKNNELLFTGTLSETLNNIHLTADNYEVNLPVKVPDNIQINNQIRLELKNASKLNAKIELQNQSVIQSILSKI